MTSPGGHRRPDPIRWNGTALPREVTDAIREQQQQDRYPY